MAPEASPTGDREWTRHAFRVLSDRGYRAGGARTAVVELVGQEGGCMDADAVARRLQDRGRRVGTASVYRTLSLLHELGLVHRVAVADGPSRYELVHPGGEHHHHIVCDECGTTVAFEDEALEEAIDRISERTSFAVLAHDVTLHGTCERCQRQGEGAREAP